MAQRQVVVVGGGISGLATAYHLARGAGGDASSPGVTVLEAAAAPGGRILTASLAGMPVDTGPDALLVRAPVAALVEDLGLTPLLRAPAGGGAYLWSRGRLRPLPAGSVFGVPQRLTPLLRSGLLGPLGFVRAGADLVLPRRRPGEDPTIEELLRPRFGRQVFERLIDPMLGGVHAGRAGRLSVRSAVPEVAALVEGHRSVYLALRGRASAGPSGPAPSAGPAGAAGPSGPAPSAGPPPRPSLMTFQGGLAVLVEALRAAVESAHGRVVTGAVVTGIAASPHGGYRVSGTGFAPIDATDVVLATPAGEAARLLRPMAPDAGTALEAIPYAGVGTVVLAYRPADVAVLRGTGFLVPPVEGRLLVGCTWLTTKWPQLRDAEAGSAVLIRGMVGRDGDQAWASMDDDDLLAAIRAELAEAMGVRAEPVGVLIRRMPGAMPQYTVGHAGRLAAASRALAGLPGLHLTGAGYRGVGIAACLAQAADAAAAVVRRPIEATVTR